MDKNKRIPKWIKKAAAMDKTAGTELWQTPEGEWYLLGTVMMKPISETFKTKSEAVAEAIRQNRWTEEAGERALAKTEPDGIGDPKEFKTDVKKAGKGFNDNFISNGYKIEPQTPEQLGVEPIMVQSNVGATVYSPRFTLSNEDGQLIIQFGHYFGGGSYYYSDIVAPGDGLLLYGGDQSGNSSISKEEMDELRDWMKKNAEVIETTLQKMVGGEVTKEAQKLSFEEWMKEVDKALEAKSGMGSADCPDYMYRDAYDKGRSPSSVASAAIRSMKEDMGMAAGKKATKHTFTSVEEALETMKKLQQLAKDTWEDQVDFDELLDYLSPEDQDLWQAADDYINATEKSARKKAGTNEFYDPNGDKIEKGMKVVLTDGNKLGTVTGYGNGYLEVTLSDKTIVKAPPSYLSVYKETKTANEDFKVGDRVEHKNLTPGGKKDTGTIIEVYPNGNRLDVKWDDNTYHDVSATDVKKIATKLSMKKLADLLADEYGYQGATLESIDGVKRGDIVIYKSTGQRAEVIAVDKTTGVVIIKVDRQNNQEVEATPEDIETISLVMAVGDLVSIVFDGEASEGEIISKDDNKKTYTVETVDGKKAIIEVGKDEITKEEPEVKTTFKVPHFDNLNQAMKFFNTTAWSSEVELKNGMVVMKHSAPPGHHPKDDILTDEDFMDYMNNDYQQEVDNMLEDYEEEEVMESLNEAMSEMGKGTGKGKGYSEQDIKQYVDDAVKKLKDAGLGVSKVEYEHTVDGVSIIYLSAKKDLVVSHTANEGDKTYFTLMDWSIKNTVSEGTPADPSYVIAEEDLIEDLIPRIKEYIKGKK